MSSRSDDQPSRTGGLAPLAPRRNSSILAMAIGGVLVALALLAFLLYDDRGGYGRDVETTASTRATTGARSAVPGLTDPARPADPQARPSPPAPARNGD